MAEQIGTMDYHLNQIGKIASSFSGDGKLLDDFFDRTVDLVIRHRNPEVVAQLALPDYNIRALLRGSTEQRQNLPEVTSGGTEGTTAINTPSYTRFPRYLQPKAQEGCHKVLVASLYLQLAKGTMNNIRSIILNVKGFARPFSIPGGYGQSIDRHMHAKGSLNVDENHGKDWYIQIHPETKQYFACIFCWVPSLGLRDESDYDIAVDMEPSLYAMRAEIEELDYLGPLPCVNGQPVHIAVQQKACIYGFHLTDEIEDRAALNGVKEQRNINTISLNTRKERMIDMSTHMMHAFKPDKVWAAGARKKFQHGRKGHRQPGTAVSVPGTL